MIICDSCKGKDGKTIKQAFDAVHFEAHATLSGEPAKSDPVHLCHSCQQDLASLTSNLAWVIRERGIAHLLYAVQTARSG